MTQTWLHSLSCVALCALGVWLSGCGPSEEDRAHGAERAALAGQQNAILTAPPAGADGCLGVYRDARAWHEAHRQEVEASDAWWSSVSDGTKDDIYSENPQFHESAEARIRLLIRCGSDGDLWDPGA
ncbi:MAG: hypothetical protein KC619_14285 [Myxococcales bacterium]|nr:hypothetical protein [Myxococcales bacterium]